MHWTTTVGVQQRTGQALGGDSGSEDRAGFPRSPCQAQDGDPNHPPGDNRWLCKGWWRLTSEPKSAPRPSPLKASAPDRPGPSRCQMGQGTGGRNPLPLSPLPSLLPLIEGLRIISDPLPMSRPHRALSWLSTEVHMLRSCFRGLPLSLIPPSPWIPMAVQSQLPCPARWIHSHPHP